MCVYILYCLCVYLPRVKVFHTVCVLVRWCGCHTPTVTCWGTVSNGKIDMEMQSSFPSTHTILTHPNSMTRDHIKCLLVCLFIVRVCSCSAGASHVPVCVHGRKNWCGCQTPGVWGTACDTARSRKETSDPPLSIPKPSLHIPGEKEKRRERVSALVESWNRGINRQRHKGLEGQS